jgi:hypothetical protein
LLLLLSVASLTRFLFSHPICLVDVAAARVFFNREIHEEPISRHQRLEAAANPSLSSMRFLSSLFAISVFLAGIVIVLIEEGGRD